MSSLTVMNMAPSPSANPAQNCSMVRLAAKDAMMAALEAARPSVHSSSAVCTLGPRWSSSRPPLSVPTTPVATVTSPKSTSALAGSRLNSARAALGP